MLKIDKSNTFVQFEKTSEIFEYKGGVKVLAKVCEDDLNHALIIVANRHGRYKEINLDINSHTVFAYYDCKYPDMIKFALMACCKSYSSENNSYSFGLDISWLDRFADIIVNAYAENE